MLATVKIKEEPLDEIEDLQEAFLKQQQEALMKQQINGDSFGQTLNLNNFHIVEEQDSIITVSAGDMKSEDELQFIDCINNTDPTKFKGVCCKCLKTFSNRGQFLKHTKRNHCITKQKCPVCPVTFVEATSLCKHLNLHRENYFFCSHHCGANFKTLLLCDEHEFKEHKITNPARIRFKHFCSFCREGFKTELQLHVHWLQITQGCGKIMQDVVLHSTNVANNNNVTNANTKPNILEKNQQQQQQSNNINSVSIIPITKLRLKSFVPKTKTTAANKRQINKEPTTEDGANTNPKRIKTLDKIKSDTMSCQLPFNYVSDIEIKEEPLDEDEMNMTTSLIPEVIIKTEEDYEELTRCETTVMEEKPKMKSLFINNIVAPEFSGKFIPIEEFANAVTTKIENKPEMTTFSINNIPKSNENDKIKGLNKLPVIKLMNNNCNPINLNNSNATTLYKNENNLMKLITITPTSLANANKNNNLTFNNIQNCSTGKLMTLKLANTHNINKQTEIKPLAKSGLQIIKFLPNTQIKTLKTINAATTIPTGNNINSNINSVNTKSPIIIKLKTPPTIAVQPNKIINPPPLVPVTSAGKTQGTKTIKKVSIKFNSIEENTTIDAEDLKKLQEEALIKAEEHRKNFYIPKNRLMLIETMPEKKQIIDSMKQQIAQVESKSSDDVKCKIENFTLNTKIPQEPTTLFLPLFTEIDVSLVEARYQNPNYVYKWICPYCLKVYEIKMALKKHLGKAHNLNNRDMEKINVQAKPYKIEDDSQIDVIPQIKIELQQDTDSQPLSSESESLTTDIGSTGSSPKAITNANVNNQQRSRYICEKCGRSCSSKTMLQDHILANCSREPQYSCKECHKKFFSHGTLQCHMTIHTGELPHKCNYCDKRFRTRGQVKVHHRTHTGERPFFCQVCSQRFTHRETLIAHLSRHIGMKRYKCYGCDKHFSCISALKTHREIRADTCGKVKFNPRAIGPRVRVIRGNVIFEPQPEINPYLKSEDPKTVLSELQNQTQST